MAFKLNGIQLKGNGGKKKTKYVTDKNSPDLKNYNDSLSAYNSYRPEFNKARKEEIAVLDRVINNTKNRGEHPDEFILEAKKFEEDDTYDADIKRKAIPYNSKDVSEYTNNDSSMIIGKHPVFTPKAYKRKEGFVTFIYKKPTNKVKYADPKIVEKQKTLQKAGLYKGELDGIMGSESNKALETYESNMAKTASKPNNPKPATTPNKPGQYTKSTQYPGVKHVYDKGTKRIVAWQNKKGKQVPFGTKFTKEFQYPK